MTYKICPTITSDQQQVIYGTLLGGSSLIKTKTSKNYFLSMRGKDLNWIQGKANEFTFMSSQNPIHEEKLGYYRWHSSCSLALNNIYPLFYKKGKKVAKVEILDALRAIGLMVWFMDSGILQDNKITMRLTSLKTSIKLIQEYFAQLDIKPKITNTSLMFNEDQSKKFIDIIFDQVPLFMEHRIELN